MKKPHLTLYGQILFWFFLNLALVGGVLFLVLRVQFKVGPWSVFSGQVNQRTEAWADLMAAELREADQAEWNSIVARYDEAYGVTFSVFRPNLGPGLGGSDQELPEALIAAVRREFPLCTEPAPPERGRLAPGPHPERPAPVGRRGGVRSLPGPSTVPLPEPRGRRGSCSTAGTTRAGATGSPSRFPSKAVSPGTPSGDSGGECRGIGGQ